VAGNDGRVSKSEDAERPVYQVLKPRTIVLISAMLVVTGLGIGPGWYWPTDKATASSR
jgi:hypothetical protein